MSFRGQVPIVLGNLAHDFGDRSLPCALFGLRLPDLNNLRGIDGCIHIAVSDVNLSSHGARDEGSNVRVHDLARVQEPKTYPSQIKVGHVPSNWDRRLS